MSRRWQVLPQLCREVPHLGPPSLTLTTRGTRCRPLVPSPVHGFPDLEEPLWTDEVHCTLPKMLVFELEDVPAWDLAGVAVGRAAGHHVTSVTTFLVYQCWNWRLEESERNDTKTQKSYF